MSDDWDELAILDTKNPQKPQLLHLEVKLPPKINYAEFGFSDNDEYFAASGRTGQNNNYTYWIMLWKREADTFVFQYAWPGQGFGSTPAFTTTEDGSTVLAVPWSEIQIWKLLPDAPQLITTLDGDRPVQFSPDGRYLFTNRDGDNFQIWDWQTSRPINHPPIPGFFSLSQDGSVVMSYDFDLRGLYLIWDIRNLLSLLPYFVEPRGKQIITIGQIKQNQLLQNFPNPFNPETWIPFRLADKNNVTIRIYTPAGKLVRALSPEIMSAGDYSSQSKAVHWDGRNDEGEPVSSSVYLYTIKAGAFSATRKMLIRK